MKSRGRMNIHHLELFYYVARHGGISKAVRLIPYGIQQPAVSSQLLKLEAELGTKLFERNPFSLTADGEELFAFVRPFFEGIDVMASRLRKRATPLLRLGAAELILRDYLPLTVERMQQNKTKVQLELRSGFTPELEAALKNREIEIAIIPVEGRSLSRTNSCRLLKLPLVLLVPKDCPLKSADELWDRSPIEHPLISLPDNETISRAFQKELRRRKIDWPTSTEASSVDLITHYVANGYGFGVSIGAADIVKHPKVRILRLEGFPSVDIVAMWNGKLSAIAQSFLQEAKTFISTQLTHYQALDAL